MRNKIIFILLLSIISLQGISQKKKIDSSKMKLTPDTISTAPVVFNDSLPFFPISSYNKFYEQIVKRLPTESGYPIIQWWTAEFQRLIMEAQKKKKPQP